MSRRNGFTLLEMVVLVLILGIAFATLPMILGVSSRSAESVATVKGLYHGVAKMQVVISKPWDEANVDDVNDGGIYYVVDTAEDAGGLVCDRNKSRAGHYPGMNRRMCEDADATLPGQFLAEADFNDIDDFDGDTDTDIGRFDITTSVGYVPYQPAGTVTFASGAGAWPTTTNLKRVSVSVSRNGNAVTEYHYYAANIGAPKPYIREMQ